MSYVVNKSDGTVLVEIPDSTLDQTTTDLTLIGKNSSNYGEFYNENLVHLLENFANSTQPSTPLVGQLWFDLTDNRLKVYDGTTFKVSGGTIVSAYKPTTIASGDIWLNSTTNQLNFQVGTDTILVGPLYTKQQGTTGWIPGDLIDSNNVLHTVVYLYVGSTLLGLFSKDQFIIQAGAPELAAFNSQIRVGFNPSTYPDIKFYAPTEQSDTLIAADGSLKHAEDFVSILGDSTILGKLSIQNSTPLVLGTGVASGLVEMNLTGSAFQIKSNASNQNFDVTLRNGTGSKSAIFANASTSKVGIYTSTPAATLDVNGDTIIRGSLTVNGSLTSINSTNLEISDKQIVISKTATPSNTTANTSGIIVPGGSNGDKQFLWQQSNLAWNSSESINIPTSKTYKIGSVDVLSETALSSGITTASGLRQIGHLTSLLVADLGINVTGTDPGVIRYSNASVANGTIQLIPKGAGTVDVSNYRISSVAAPVATTDAVNKIYVDSAVANAPIGFSADTTGLSVAQIASTILTPIFPVSDYANGTICRVHCVASGVRTNKKYQIVSGTWTYIADI